jgi:hypothetical protein
LFDFSSNINGLAHAGFNYEAEAILFIAWELKQSRLTSDRASLASDETK